MKRITPLNEEVRTTVTTKAAIRAGLALAVVLAIAGGMSFAGVGRFGIRKSFTRSVVMNFSKATKLNNGEELKAGEYTIKIPYNITPSQEVEFYLNDQLVAKAQVKVETLPQRNDFTSFEMASQGYANLLLAIRPEGMPERLVFSESSGE